MIMVPNIVKARQEELILLMMLETFHFATWYGIGSYLYQSLLLIHFGMFLLWQPLLKENQKITWGKGLLFVTFILAFVYWANWISITLWLVLLIGFIGGRVTTRRYERNVYMLVMVFLIFELLISIVPQMFGLSLNINVLNVFLIGLPLLPLLLVITSNTFSKRAGETVDILLATSISFMVIILALGSLVLMYHNNSDYIISLIQTLIIVGILLISISWLLSTHSGFSGLSQLWAKSLLNIGTPFEQWLAKLSIQKQLQQSPADFLDTAMRELVSLPWIAGATWSGGSTHGIYGEITRYEVHLAISVEPITLFTHVQPAGVMSLHCKLLVQLIETFYIAKKQEQELEQQAHLRAIYETGARMTHDIKNLLQSLQTMTALLETDSDETREKSLTLLKKQLPNISQRLQLALDKLQAPEEESAKNIQAMTWWNGLSARREGSQIKFLVNIDKDTLIPEGLFDSVLENLLENAIHKRQVDSDITIIVSLNIEPTSIALTVTDTGHAVARGIRKLILKEHVASDNGHGIGLYQAARQAESLGYTLRLIDNRDGNVCFQLSKQITS
jgi:signal transduction histidine kinase